MSGKVKELTCLWNNCNLVISIDNDLRALSSHLASHLPDLNIVCDDDEDESYECGWDSCQFHSKSSVEITLHVKYHAYHSRLKELGLYYIKKRNLPVCSFPKPLQEQIPPTTDLHKCEWKNCAESFDCYETFLLHIKIYHITTASPNKKQHFICMWRDCESITNLKTRLSAHMRLHTGERTVACPVCGHMFSGVTKYDNHCSRQIPIEEHRFKCSHCFNRYPNARLLQDHMSLHVHHFKCSFCDLTCRAPSILAKHIRYRHLSYKPFKCAFCNYKCKTSYDLKVHHSTHTGSVFSCEEEGCDYTFTKEYNLAKHVEQVHESSTPHCYKCHICEKCFSRGYNLTNHLKKVHNVEKPNGFSRFLYRRDEDGYWRLQTTRLESVMVTEDGSYYSDSDSGREDGVIEIRVMEDDDK